MTTDGISRFLGRLADCVRDGVLLTVMLTSPRSGEVEKMVGTPRSIGGKPVIQLEFRCTEGRVRQENVPPEALADRLSPLFSVFRCGILRHRNGGTGQVLISKKGKATYSEDPRFRAVAPVAVPAFSVPLPPNNREKTGC